MANLKISQLPIVTGTTNDILAVVQSGVTSQIPIQHIVDLVPATTFTGNTSGTCITDIYVTNLHSCSPLNFLEGETPVASLDATTGFKLNDGIDLVLGVGSKINGTSGLTVNDLIIENLGTGTSVNTLGIDVSGNIVSATTTTISSTYVDLGNVAGSVTIDGNAGKHFLATMTGNTNYTFTNFSNGDEFILMSAQGTAGNVSNFLDADMRWEGGGAPLQFPTISTYSLFKFVKMGNLISGTHFANYSL